MKAIISALILVVVFLSCTSDNVGPAGPTGAQGNDGPKGEKGDSGFVFEYEKLTFTGPDYELFLPFPDDFESLNSDVALVYLLWDVVQVDGVNTEVWRQLPQTLLTDKGMLQYNFDFTLDDVRLFMDAEFDLALLGEADTDNWIARVVIVPGEFWNSSRMISEEIPYSEVIEILGLPELPIPNSLIDRRN